jgi:hypothetical protein
MRAWLVARRLASQAARAQALLAAHCLAWLPVWLQVRRGARGLAQAWQPVVAWRS